MCPLCEEYFTNDIIQIHAATCHTTPPSATTIDKDTMGESESCVIELVETPER